MNLYGSPAKEMRRNRGQQIPSATGIAPSCGGTGSTTGFQQQVPTKRPWVVCPSGLWHHATSAWSRIGGYAGRLVTSGQVMVADTSGSVQFSIGRVMGDSIGV